MRAGYWILELRAGNLNFKVQSGNKMKTVNSKENELLLHIIKGIRDLPSFGSCQLRLDIAFLSKVLWRVL